MRFADIVSTNNSAEVASFGQTVRSTLSFWMLPGFTLSILLSITYLTYTSSPVSLGGLYFAGARAIAENGFLLPETLPHYTAGGVPFAYPPLHFYVTATYVHVLDIPMETVAVIVPALYFVALQPPLFFFTREIAGDERIAGAACVVFACSPLIQRVSFTGAAVLYSGALFFNIVAAFAGVRYFKTERPKWLIFATVAWACILASHPGKSAWIAISYIFLWAWFSRTRRGFLGGALVAIGGFALTSPWWATVVSRHGIEVYLHAAGTHSGLFPLDFTFESYTQYFESHRWHLLGLLGAGFLTVRGRPVVAVWYLVTEAAIPTVGFTILLPVLFAAGLVAGIEYSVRIAKRVVSEISDRPLRESFPTTIRLERIVSIFLLGVLVVAIIPSGIATVETTASRQPLEPGDQQAMEWVRTETPADARFMVVGWYEYDWFPAIADRTVVANVYGAEWEATGQAKQAELRSKLSNCGTVECVEGVSSTHELGIRYIYVSQGFSRADLVDSAETSASWTTAYEKDGVVILERVE